MTNLRTFETARLIRVQHCKLKSMTDEELQAEIELYSPKSSKMYFSDAVYNECRDSADIMKEWRTSSPMVRGASPYISNGVMKTKRAKAL